MFRRGQGCPRFFCEKDGEDGESEEGQMGRAIPEVYQGYTKTIDI